MNVSHVCVPMFGIALVACLGSPRVMAQEGDAARKRLESSPRHHEWVEIKTKSNRVVRAFLVYPEASKAVPAVLVIHENRGLTDWVRGVADQVAEAGYVALAPDMLSSSQKEGTTSFPSGDAAREGIYRLKPDQIMEELDACAEYLLKLDAVNQKVAVGGFCWGGGQAFSYAAHNPHLAAAFVFYGTAPDVDALQHIKAPVYGFYGGNDFRISGQVPKVKESMSKLRKPYEPVIYEGASHGFMRGGEEPGGTSADRDAREKAWKRWKELLKTTEQGTSSTRPAADRP